MGSSPVSLFLPSAPASLIQQILSIVCNPDVSGSLNNRYFFLNEVSGPGAYIWFNVGSQGINPGPFGSVYPGLYSSSGSQRTSIEVSFAQNASASTIASAIASALSSYSSRWSTSVTSGTIVITNVVGGVVPGGNTVSGLDQGTGFAFSLSQIGAINQAYNIGAGAIVSIPDAAAAQVQAALFQNPSLEIVQGGVAQYCSFNVAHSDSGGLGLTGLLASSAISGVYAYSSAPISGNVVPSGCLQVFFNQAFNKLLGAYVQMYSPNSGSNVSAGSFTPGLIYVITSVGSTNWVTAGVPSNVTPAVGVAFIAAAAGSGSGTAQVQSVSKVSHLELIGNPALSLAGSNGGYFLGQFIAPTISTGAFVSPYVATQPADNTVVTCSFFVG